MKKNLRVVLGVGIVSMSLVTGCSVGSCEEEMKSKGIERSRFCYI